MTFSIEHAAVHRARSALDLAYNEASQAAKRKAFIRIAGELLRADNPAAAYERLQFAGDALVSKAAAANLAAIGSGSVPGDMRSLCEAFVASTAPGSIFDWALRYGRPMPKAGRFLLGGGAATTDSETPELGHITWADSGLSVDDAAARQTAAIFAASNELQKLGGEAFDRLLADELSTTVATALNHAVIDVVAPGAGSASAGASALESLKSGLAALDSARGVIVVAGPAATAELILSDANRLGAGLKGGELLPGLALVPVDSVTNMTLIECSRAAVWDGGLELGQAQHADLVVAYDSHGEPLSRVGLFQCGASAIRAVRAWAIGGGVQSVVVS